MPSLYRRATEVTEATLGKDDPNLSLILNNLASLLQEQVRARVCGFTSGYFKNTEMDVLARCFAAAVPRCLFGRASMRMPSLPAAVRWRSRSRPKDHPNFSFILKNLAMSLRKQVGTRVCGSTLDSSHAKMDVPIRCSCCCFSDVSFL